MIRPEGFFKLCFQPLTKRGYPLRMACLIALMLACITASAEKKTPEPLTGMPDVLVMVLSGMGPFDQVSVNYTTVVSEEDAKKDVGVLIKDFGWAVQKHAVTTKSSNTPGGKPTTSSVFEVPSSINRTEGTLPVAPFVTMLKRFKDLQVNYLMVSEFEFRGLKDFENEYVKIDLKGSGNSYLYRIHVKRDDFERLELPLKKEAPAAEQATGMAAGTRVALVLGLALTCSLIAYLAAGYAMRRRRNA